MGSFYEGTRGPEPFLPFYSLGHIFHYFIFENMDFNVGEGGVGILCRRRTSVKGALCHLCHHLRLIQTGQAFPLFYLGIVQFVHRAFEHRDSDTNTAA